MKNFTLATITALTIMSSAQAMNINLNCVPTEYSIHINGEEPWMQDVHSDAFTINMDTDVPYAFYGMNFSVKVFDANIAGFGPGNEGFAQGT